MADVDLAIDYVLSWEDSTLSGKITVDAGGRTRFGIAEKFHPELSNSLFYISMGSAAALAIARGIYANSYCDPLCIVEIADQGVANKLLSLGVNIGVKEASKMLQDAVRVVGDGRIGPLTLMALSNAAPAEVIDNLRAAAARYYIEDVQQHPDKQQYLKGWLRRANA